MTILSFPEGRALQSNLDQKKKELDDIYDALNRLHRLTDQIENDASDLEAEYNIYLRRYANALGGVENVEVGYLEYSSGIGIDVDSGDIIFTPWSEEDETEV